MSDPFKQLDALLQGAAAAPQSFPQTSRYHGLATATLVASDGRTHVYLTRRFLPQVDRFVVVREHVVQQGDRLDTLAAKYLGDAEQYWRICDANGAIRPEELTETPGRRVRITLPEGIPSGSGDL